MQVDEPSQEDVDKVGCCSKYKLKIGSVSYWDYERLADTYHNKE